MSEARCRYETPQGNACGCTEFNPIHEHNHLFMAPEPTPQSDCVCDERIEKARSGSPAVLDIAVEGTVQQCQTRRQ